MLKNIGYIQFRTHAVQISQDTDNHRIYCFKFTKTRCDISSFELESEASDYILEPFPTVEYQVSVEGE